MQDLLHTCYEMYKQMPTGLSPEIAYFRNTAGSTEVLFLCLPFIKQHSRSAGLGYPPTR